MGLKLKAAIYTVVSLNNSRMKPQQKKSMHVISRAQSFWYAVSGLVQLIVLEPNARIHTVATIAVVTAGFFRHLDPGKWMAILIAIGIVWITEALNTCIEKLCNIWCKNEWHPEVKVIKDIAAGAVLISAIISIIIGVIVFFF